MPKIKKPGDGYIELDLGKVFEYAKIGLTEEQIANNFGVSRATISRRKANDEAFATAYKNGKAAGIQLMTNKGWEMAMAGNVPVWIFWMKNNAEWADRTTIEGNPKKPISVQNAWDAALKEGEKGKDK